MERRHYARKHKLGIGHSDWLNGGAIEENEGKCRLWKGRPGCSRHEGDLVVPTSRMFTVNRMQSNRVHHPFWVSWRRRAGVLARDRERLRNRKRWRLTVRRPTRRFLKPSAGYAIGEFTAIGSWNEQKVHVMRC
jgi:hypothetical protein